MASKTDYHKTYIKICGLFRPEDIFYVNEARPDYAGFIINFEKSHRNVSSDTVVSLKKLLLPDIKSVGVFVDEDISSICIIHINSLVKRYLAVYMLQPALAFRILI